MGYASGSNAFETTLSGVSYANKIEKWKALGYEMVLLYFWLPSVDMAIERVKTRVQQGGHNIPEEDIRRRFTRSWDNFNNVYKLIVDKWLVVDTSFTVPKLVESYGDVQ